MDEMTILGKDVDGICIYCLHIDTEADIDYVFVSRPELRSVISRIMTFKSTF